jgi:Tfp pilus assembly protein PilF
MCAATACWLAGCASTMPPPDPRLVLDDAAYGPSETVLSADAVMAASPQMQQFAAQLTARSQRRRDLRTALLDSFRRDGPLALRYDGSFTRTAAQAFEARAGNCLSLVLMTASLARELGMPVTFQAVTNEEEFMRQDQLLFASGHVNVVLGSAVSGVNHWAHDADRELTVDFLPVQDLAGQRVTPVSEATVQAMFLNNRAAELLGAGRAREAYWWARQAALWDPGFLPALTTLGVVHLRSGRAAQAEAAFRQVLQHDARQTSAMTNLVRVLEQQGHTQELRVWTERLAALQPEPPFAKLDQGRAVLASGETARARDLFLAELRHQPFQPEVHYWLAVALARLGDTARAERHLAMAVDHSTTAATQSLYAGKLERLRQASK